jgi:transposase
MNKEHQRCAKAILVAALQEGLGFQQAAQRAGIHISQSNAYRLWLAVRKHGEAALSDGRHGHPSKLRTATRAFLEEQCRLSPSTSSSTIQAALRERFDLQVSVSQINRVRAALGVSNHSKRSAQEKKR